MTQLCDGNKQEGIGWSLLKVKKQAIGQRPAACQPGDCGEPADCKGMQWQITLPTCQLLREIVNKCQDTQEHSCVRHTRPIAVRKMAAKRRAGYPRNKDLQAPLTPKQLQTITETLKILAKTIPLRHLRRGARAFVRMLSNPR